MVYFVKGDGNGTHLFNGQAYYTLPEYSSTLGINFSTVSESANFGTGSLNGAETQFVVAAPEPGAALGSLVLAGLALRRRRRSR
jgi:MYXO-CTERM domain-containing protein